jgi:triphosphatase
VKLSGCEVVKLRCIDQKVGALETELKFQVPAASRQALRRAVATATAQTTRLQAVYAETADLRLAQAGLALRLRKEGRVWVQTLKGRGDGLLNRLEHEVPLPPQRGAPSLDVQRHAGTPAGEVLFKVLAQGGDSQAMASLRPLYRTDIRRLHRRLRVGGAVIEIAYDVGHIFAFNANGADADTDADADADADAAVGEHSVVVDEIEFELVSGPATALVSLAQKWVQRFDLWWDSRTKSERGLRLALGKTQVPAVKTQLPLLAAETAPAAVWQSALQATLAHALPNAAEIASGTATPEHLHQLRVALRRLRTVLRLLAPWSGDAATAQAALALEAAWRRPFANLGVVRDADVLLTLQPQLAAAGAPEFLWPATASTDTDDVGAMLRSASFADLLLRCLALALAPPAEPRAAASASAPAGSDELGVDPDLQAAARAVLRSAWRQVLADAQAFAHATTEARHRTRRRLKRFRYVFEILMPLFKRKPSQRLLKAVCAALDALGALNDLQTAQMVCRVQAAHDARAWFAVGWTSARQEVQLIRATDAMHQLADASQPWRRKVSAK